MDNLEENDYCEVSVRFGVNGQWTIMAAYRGNEGELLRFAERSIVFNNEDVTATQLFVRLATNGDSSSGRDYCYYDNVYLFGTGKAPATQANVFAAAADIRQAFDPFEHQVMEQHGGNRLENETDHAADDRYFAVGATTNALLWIGAVGIWFAACVALFWYRRIAKQLPVKLQRVRIHDEHSVADDV